MSSAQYSTMLCRVVECSKVMCSAVRWGAVEVVNWIELDWSAVQCKEMREEKDESNMRCDKIKERSHYIR